MRAVVHVDPVRDFMRDGRRGARSRAPGSAASCSGSRPRDEQLPQRAFAIADRDLRDGHAGLRREFARFGASARAAPRASASASIRRAKPSRGPPQISRSPSRRDARASAPPSQSIVSVASPNGIAAPGDERPRLAAVSRAAPRSSRAAPPPRPAPASSAARLGSVSRTRPLAGSNAQPAPSARADGARLRWPSRRTHNSRSTMMVSPGRPPRPR